MQPPAFPENELQRLAALRERAILDTRPEARFDRLTRLAQQMFGTQMALVSLVDAERQWFKSRQGLDACQTGRDISFCGHAILGTDIFHVADAMRDPRFADNPLVTGPPHIRFYAGAPLSTKDGYRIGTLCIIDDQSRQLTAAELRTLRDLADCVEEEINRSDQHKQEQVLNQFKSTLDRTLDCVFMFDAQNLRFFYANQGALLQVGYDLDELRDMHPYDIKPDIDAARFRELIAPLLSGERASLTFETAHQHKNGQRLPVEIFYQYMAPSDEPPRFVAIVRDISERKQAEAERNHIATLLNNILDAASEVSIIATDPQGLITTFNRGAERLLGYTAEEMVGQQTPAIIHLPAEVVARGNALSAQFGRPIEGFRVFVEMPERHGSEKREWTYVHKDGQPIPVSLVVTTMRADTGEIIGYLGIAEDITERKRAEIALRDQAERTQAILDNMIDGIITIDQAGIVHSFTPAAERIFGYTSDEVLGRNVKMLMPNPHRDAHDGYLRNYQATGVARIIGIGREVEGQRKDGSLFPMDLAISEITHQGKPMYVGMVRDITERKRVERMKSEFVSTVSHELRTPLTAISGALGLLAGDALGELPTQAQQMIAIAHKNSLRLTHLINDLLDMEKIAAGKLHFDLQPQALRPLLEQALEANRSYGAERRVTLALTGAASDVQVRVDSQRLMQVLSNLLSNAIKYSPEDGTVEVAMEQREKSLRVTVTDHGPGIPQAFSARIFEKFAQADSSDTRQKGGTGLGLAITRELVERMGGRIGFESVEGQGARFHFDLPLWNAQGPDAATSPDVSLAADAARILVVEDEPDIAHLLGLMLTRAGYAVDIANSGAEALAALQQSHYAAMTLDLMLPDIGGLEIIRQVRQRPETADLPIVVVSAKVEEGRLAINGDFSGIDWQAKPIDETRLLSMLERQLSAGMSEQTPRVLHVEDDADLHQVLSAMLGGRFDFELATTLREARARIGLEHFDVVILDLSLPDGSGWELLPEIRAHLPDARVVILSGTDLTPDETRKVEAVLLKTQVSPRELLDTLNSRIQSSRPEGNQP
ncbi:MAG: hypothetical protein B7Y41_08875 [Hydrogenophilales bacterium 28-61-23]|nr:MAG: hypothetical protein B7Y41_08875 [Hydrogenophilales bacterium 28-61-23]